MSGTNVPFPSADQIAPYGVDEAGWRLLVNTLYPAATSAEQVLAVLEFCRVRKYDPFRRPVHLIVRKAQYNKDKTLKTPETFEIWPGINSIMSDAAASGKWAGLDKPELGEMYDATFIDSYEAGGQTRTKNIAVRYPDYCCITVYRRAPDGSREGYALPVYWQEAYATVSPYSDVPNRMWQKRPIGMLQKCALAASLRAAFPEITDYAAEEMDGFEDDGRIEGEPVRSIGQTKASDQSGTKAIAHERTIDQTGDILRSREVVRVSNHPEGNMQDHIVGMTVSPPTKPNGAAHDALPPGPFYVSLLTNERGGLAWGLFMNGIRTLIGSVEPTVEAMEDINKDNHANLMLLKEKSPQGYEALMNEQRRRVDEAAMIADKPEPIPQEPVASADDDLPDWVTEGTESIPIGDRT